MALIVIDLGTSSVKVALYDHETGEILSTGRGHYRLYSEKQGYAEQNPEEWWTQTKYAIQECLHRAKISPKSIKGIGLSGQMCGVVPVTKSGQPLYNCITHLDTRCVEEIASLRERQEDVLRIGMNPITNLMSAPKLMWLKNNRKDVWDQAHKWLMPKDYIRLKLTGTFGTDSTDASATLFMDFNKKTWDPLIEHFGLDITKFPEVNLPYELVGSVTKSAAEETGLAPGTPLAAGAADMACTALGTRAVSEGNISVTIGTAGHLIAPIAAPDPAYAGRLYQFCHAVPDMYYAFGSIPAGGLSLSWLIDLLNPLLNDEPGNNRKLTYEKMNRMAEESTIGSKGLFFLPYLAGSVVPYADPKAKGTFIGLSIRHSYGDMARAVMEGVAYNFRQIVELLDLCNIPAHQLFFGEGGMNSQIWTRILTSVMNRGNAFLMKDKDSAPLGAAIIAGMGTGLYHDWNDAVNKLSQVETVPNDLAMAESYSKLYRIYEGLYPTLKTTFEQIYDMEGTI
ncbi:xylulokinase [Cohnella faecalis]|uniref:Xylulokinase n=1 Tax=Cohnella faecalis TaxID=2315694 RepID=A0A398CHJ5_9BACL|nr:FGGY family carbohydrate kinase [Cohnella faecalis]RIE00398.1 hypothetical protein D3H35_28720 [Cohnella faecalis]